MPNVKTVKRNARAAAARKARAAAAVAARLAAAEMAKASDDLKARLGPATVSCVPYFLVQGKMVVAAPGGNVDGGLQPATLYSLIQAGSKTIDSQTYGEVVCVPQFVNTSGRGTYARSAAGRASASTSRKGARARRAKQDS